MSLWPLNGTRPGANEAAFSWPGYQCSSNPFGHWPSLVSGIQSIAQSFASKFLGWDRLLGSSLPPYWGLWAWGRSQRFRTLLPAVPGSRPISWGLAARCGDRVSSRMARPKCSFPLVPGQRDVVVTAMLLGDVQGAGARGRRIRTPAFAAARRVLSRCAGLPPAPPPPTRSGKRAGPRLV